MNVWFVNHYALPPQSSGGTRHYSLARELIRRGHHVTIIASSVDYMRRQDTILRPGETARLVTLEQVPFLWLRTPPYQGNSPRRLWNMLAFAFRLLREAPRHLAQPDVILGSSPHLFAAWAAYRLARRFRVPFVLEIRDLWPQTMIDVGGFSPYHPLVLWMAWLERTLYLRAQAIITLLPGGPDYIAQKVGRTHNVFWIPNGVDFTLLPEPAPPPPEPPFIVMYAGAHGVANGLETALRAAHLLQQQGWDERIHFHFIGDGPRKTHLQTLARTWQLRNVVFEPPVPKEHIYSRLQRAHAFLMILRDSPLFRWGISPNKLYDFMAMARPILFCVQTPYNPVAEHQAGYTVPPDNPEALASALRTLASQHPHERWQMGLRARAYVEREHHLQKLAARLEDVLLRVV